jgi:hypothetical protein
MAPSHFACGGNSRTEQKSSSASMRVSLGWLELQHLSRQWHIEPEAVHPRHVKSARQFRPTGPLFNPHADNGVVDPLTVELAHMPSKPDARAGGLAIGSASTWNTLHKANKIDMGFYVSTCLLFCRPKPGRLKFELNRRRAPGLKLRRGFGWNVSAIESR